MKTPLNRLIATSTLGLLLFAFSASAAYPLKEIFTLPNPPAIGSTESQADYATLHQIENSRTAAECKLAGTQSTMDPNSFFGPKTGLLTPNEFAIILPLFTELRETAEAEAKPFKQKYARVRPYNADKTLHPCVQKPGGATSYPSSHAAAGELLGRVLSDLFPERRTELLAQGIQIGENRLIGGVHHPSDVRAGQELADEIYEAVEKNPQFLKDFADAKKELNP